MADRREGTMTSQMSAGTLPTDAFDSDTALAAHAPFPWRLIAVLAALPATILLIPLYAWMDRTFEFAHGLEPFMFHNVARTPASALVFTQVSLIGIWLALGTRRDRFVLAFAALTILVSMTQQFLAEPSGSWGISCLWIAAAFLATVVPLGVVRLWGWQLGVPREALPSDAITLRDAPLCALAAAVVLLPMPWFLDNAETYKVSGPEAWPPMALGMALASGVVANLAVGAVLGRGPLALRVGLLAGSLYLIVGFVPLASPTTRLAYFVTTVVQGLIVVATLLTARTAGYRLDAARDGRTGPAGVWETWQFESLWQGVRRRSALELVVAGHLICMAGQLAVELALPFYYAHWWPIPDALLGAQISLLGLWLILGSGLNRFYFGMLLASLLPILRGHMLWNERYFSTYWHSYLSYQVLVIVAPLGLLRATGWRLDRAPSGETPARHRVGIRHLFGWMLTVACLLGGLRWLLEWQGDVLWKAVHEGLAGLLAMWLVFGRTRPARRVGIGILVAALVMAAGKLKHSGDQSELVLEGVLVALTLLAARSSGYRMTQGDATEPAARVDAPEA